MRRIIGIPPGSIASPDGERPVEKIRTRDKYAPKEALEAIARANQRIVDKADVKDVPHER